MSASDNLALVQRVYASKAAPEVLQETMIPEVVWDITPGFPGGRVFNGLESVGRDFFGPLMEYVDAFYPVGDEFFTDDQGHVIALGHYHVEARNGKTADVRFAHIWTARDGKLVKLQQTGDSLIVDQTLKG